MGGCWGGFVCGGVGVEEEDSSEVVMISVFKAREERGAIFL